MLAIRFPLEKQSRHQLIALILLGAMMMLENIAHGIHDI